MSFNFDADFGSISFEDLVDPSPPQFRRLVDELDFESYARRREANFSGFHDPDLEASSHNILYPDIPPDPLLNLFATRSETERYKKTQQARASSGSAQSSQTIDYNVLKVGTVEDGQICLICHAPWSQTGEHRLVSLRCGHLFGYCCVLKWIKGTGKGCPTCKVYSAVNDIRVIYARCITAMDSSELDIVQSELADMRQEKMIYKYKIDLMQKTEKMYTEKIQKLETTVSDLRTALKLAVYLPNVSADYTNLLSDS